MDPIQKAIADSMAELRTAIGAQLQALIEKYEGQRTEQGAATLEVRMAVAKLADQWKATDDRIRELEQRGITGLRGTEQAKSPGELFVQSELFKAVQSGAASKARVEVAASWKSTTINSTGTTFPAQNQGVIAGGFVPLTIRQLLTAIPVTTNAVNSLREATWTNSAAEVSEGAAKPESDITFEPYDVPVRTIAHWLKVSNQLLADAPAVAAYIDSRLRDGLAQRVESSLLNGNGNSPNISGFTDSGNFTAFTPESDETLTDSINRAKYALWAAGYMPTGVVVNPVDWGAMERMREGANSGMYLYGTPGSNAGVTPFGIPVALSPKMATGKFHIGDYRGSATLWERAGAVVEAGYVDDDFTKNLVTLRAEERLGLGVERPAAFMYGDYTVT